MGLIDELKRYDLEPGDLIEFTDDEIWAKDWENIDLFACIKGDSDFGFTTCGTVLEGRTIKRVMRTNWIPRVTAPYNLRMDFNEIKPRPRKTLVTVELDSDSEMKVGDIARIILNRSCEPFISGKVVEVKEK